MKQKKKIESRDKNKWKREEGRRVKKRGKWTIKDMALRREEGRKKRPRKRMKNEE